MFAFHLQRRSTKSHKSTCQNSGLIYINMSCTDLRTLPSQSSRHSLDVDALHHRDSGGMYLHTYAYELSRPSSQVLAVSDCVHTFLSILPSTITSRMRRIEEREVRRRDRVTRLSCMHARYSWWRLACRFRYLKLHR